MSCRLWCSRSDSKYKYVFLNLLRTQDKNVFTTTLPINKIALLIDGAIKWKAIACLLKNVQEQTFKKIGQDY